MDNALSFALWAIIIGVLLISMVLSGSLLKRLPLSTAMLYPRQLHELERDEYLVMKRKEIRRQQNAQRARVAE